MPQKSLAMKTVRKKVDNINKVIQETYVFNLETYYIPKIQDIILQEYDIELTGRVTDRKARTNPIYYREEFAEALVNFEWVDISPEATTLMVPEINTFNWGQGRLRIIENILEGSIGVFVEIDEEQYVAMYDKRPIIQPFDKAVPRRERIYIVKLTGDVRRRWRTAYPNKGLVRYPFSNQPPIDIFGPADKYVEENIKGWIDEAVKESLKETSK
jgi:hypothetical protein